LKSWPQGPSGRFDVADDYSMVWTSRVRRNRNGSEAGDELFQQFEILAEHFRD
jgi:hypothetical protein